MPLGPIGCFPLNDAARFDAPFLTFHPADSGLVYSEMLFAILLMAGLAALLAQVCLPAPEWLQGASWEVAPLLAVCGALFLNPAAAWMLALCIGISRDLVSENHLGWGAVCLLATVLLVQTQEIPRWRHRWYAQSFFVLVGTMVFLLMDYAGFCLQQRRFSPEIFRIGPFYKMIVVSGFNAMVAPLLCALIEIGKHLFGPAPQPQKETTHDR